MNAGVGFGGGCLPKDIRGCVACAHEPDVGQALESLGDVDAINLRCRARVTEMVRKELESLEGKVVAMWGALKLDIAESLSRAWVIAPSADPQAVEPAKRRLKASGIGASLSLTTDPRQAATAADAFVVATEWPQFTAKNPEDIASPFEAKWSLTAATALMPLPAWLAEGFCHRGMGLS